MILDGPCAGQTLSMKQPTSRSYCKEKFIKINGDINSGSSRYRREEFYGELRNDISEFRKHCGNILSDYLDLRIDYIVGKHKLDETIDLVEQLIGKSDDGITDWEEMYFLSYVSKLKFKSETTESNFSRRKRALKLADRNGCEIEALSIMVSWLFARVTLKHIGESQEMIKEIDDRFSTLSDSKKNDPRLSEIRSRFLSHKAAVVFQRVLNKDESSSEQLDKGNKYYDEAVKLVLSDDHRRVNTLIEWAARLATLYENDAYDDFDYIESILSRALVGLDSHYCDPCLAYFHLVEAKCLYIRGEKNLPYGKSKTVELFRKATQSSEESIRVYEKLGHHYVKEPSKLLERITRSLKMLEISNKIFLSHKSDDKSIVRRFHNLLEVLGFEPWFDESSLPPYNSVYRGIADGMRESCACVFFITQHFVDKEYIKEEINLAKQVQISKGEELFRIIPIVLGKDVIVPEIIRDTTTCAVFDNELDAFSHIIKWLPVKVGTVIPNNY